MRLSKYSMGVGDRFGCQGKAQLQAFVEASRQGVEVAPVWNKSHREHQIIGTSPDDVRTEADAAVAEIGWTGAYFVDADHIGLGTVDAFLTASDFFTLDVAESIGGAGAEDAVFLGKLEAYVGEVAIPGLREPFQLGREMLRTIAAKYLPAVREAGRIYRHITAAKGAGNFVTEVSMDETDDPQTPPELFVILAASADEGIPVQTIAPEFSGRFNEGVDYVGELDLFSAEIDQDLAVITFAVDEFGLPPDLKLSVHSGSDKFSLYEPIRQAIRRHDAGLHLKTAGTTWLEELAALAEAGGQALELAQNLYRGALERFDELCGPYATVVDIAAERLPSAQAVASWSGEQFAAAVRHDSGKAAYNPDLRQLLHVGYKLAAELGDRYSALLRAHEEAVSRHVTANLLDRHLCPLFLD